MSIDKREVHEQRSAGFPSLLRGWRDRSTAVASATQLRSRRAPGLRREELAALAGISVDYLVQLEQGRAVKPSAPVLAALARALRLNLTDAALLYRAAGLAPPTSAVARSAPSSAERLLTRAGQWPAAIYAADWWLLDWNSAWSALMGDPIELAGRARNQAWFEMTEDTTSLWVDHDERETFRDALVGDLRVAQIAHPDDAELRALITDLHATSEEFSDRWRTARPAVYQGAQKNIHHPAAGDMTLDGDVFCPRGSDVRVIIYSAAPGSRDEVRLNQLTLAT